MCPPGENENVGTGIFVGVNCEVIESLEQAGAELCQALSIICIIIVVISAHFVPSASQVMRQIYMNGDSHHG